MSCTDQQTTQSYFGGILNQMKPKARYISQMHVQEFIDSIYLQIINGDTQVATEKIEFENKNEKYGFQDMLKMRILKQAERQKQVLEQKLSYLSNSINALNRYTDLNQRKSAHNIHGHDHQGTDSRQRQKQWRRQFQQRSRQLKQKKKQIEEIKTKKQEQLKEIEQRMKQEEAEKKRKEILENMRNIEQRSKKRQEVIKSANERYKQLKRQKSLHQRLEDSYNEKELSFLEQRKKKLAEIRNFHRPLDQLEIKEHEQRFLQSKKQKEELRQREKRMNQSRSNSYQPFYKSVFYQKALQDSRNQYENVELAKKQKIKQYADKIKQQFMPGIDEKKRQEIEQFLEKQKKKIQVRQERQRQLLEKPKQKGLQYLQLVKKLPKNRRTSLDLSAQPKTERRQYQNYLTHSQKEPVKPWNKILSSTGDKQEKALQLQYQSLKHEEQLKRKQQQVRLLKKGSSGQIDQQYFEMIKAKLDLLSTQK